MNNSHRQRNEANIAVDGVAVDYDAGAVKGGSNRNNSKEMQHDDQKEFQPEDRVVVAGIDLMKKNNTANFGEEICASSTNSSQTCSVADIATGTSRPAKSAAMPRTLANIAAAAAETAAKSQQCHDIDDDDDPFFDNNDEDNNQNHHRTTAKKSLKHKKAKSQQRNNNNEDDVDQSFDSNNEDSNNNNKNSPQTGMNTTDPGTGKKKDTRRKSLPVSTREAIYKELLLGGVTEDGNLPHGRKQQIATMFGVCRKTVTRIWVRGYIQKVPLMDYRMNNTGKRKYDRKELRERLIVATQQTKNAAIDPTSATGTAADEGIGDNCNIIPTTASTDEDGRGATSSGKGAHFIRSIRESALLLGIPKTTAHKYISLWKQEQEYERKQLLKRNKIQGGELQTPSENNHTVSDDPDETKEAESTRITTVPQQQLEPQTNGDMLVVDENNALQPTPRYVKVILPDHHPVFAKTNHKQIKPMTAIDGAKATINVPHKKNIDPTIGIVPAIFHGTVRAHRKDTKRRRVDLTSKSSCNNNSSSTKGPAGTAASSADRKQKDEQDDRTKGDSPSSSRKAMKNTSKHSKKSSSTKQQQQPNHRRLTTTIDTADNDTDDVDDDNDDDHDNDSVMLTCKFCIFCGQQLPLIAKFCMICGKKQNISVQATTKRRKMNIATTSTTSKRQTNTATGSEEECEV